MGQQRQFVVHINQALCLIYIQIVSFHILDEVVGAPTPLYRSIINYMKAPSPPIYADMW